MRCAKEGRWLPFAPWVLMALLVMPVTAWSAAEKDGTGADAPVGAATADPYADLYPDTPMPDADVGQPADAAVEPTERVSRQPARDDAPFADLYPDADLPGETDDPFYDLYPDVALPGPAEVPALAEDSGPDNQDLGEGKGEEVVDAGDGDGDENVEMVEQLFGARSKAPWEDDGLAGKQIEGPRDLLDLFYIDDSQLRAFVDGRPLDSEEEETLISIIYRLPRFALDQIHVWEDKNPTWEELLGDPETFRANLYRVHGRVREIVRVRVIPEVAERLEFGHYYRVSFDIADSPHRAVVCTRNIPNAWIRAQNEGVELDERAGFSGLFLKVGEGGEEGAEFVFATRRVAWFPDRVNDDLGVNKDWTILGYLGMDVGLLELVRDRGRVGIDDREPLYQMLDAMQRATNDELEPHAAQTHDIEAMLMKPETQRGKLMQMRGNVRRALLVEVADADIQKRFGIDHYYSLTVFVPLEKRIEVPMGEGNEPKRFDHTYPMEFCVRRLPEGMPRGPDIREPVPIEIPAFYFKLWAYRSEYMSSEDREKKQMSPMLIGVEPRWIQPEETSNPWFSIALGVLFIVAVTGVWLGLWQFSRSDRRFERETLAKQFELSKGASLDQMGIEASEGPDFSHLDAEPDVHDGESPSPLGDR